MMRWSSAGVIHAARRDGGGAHIALVVGTACTVRCCWAAPLRTAIGQLSLHSRHALPHRLLDFGREGLHAVARGGVLAGAHDAVAINRGSPPAGI